MRLRKPPDSDLTATVQILPFSNIRFGLVAVFALLIAALGVVGWQGADHLRRLNAQTQEIFSQHWQKSKITREAFRLSNLNNRITLLVFMLEDQDEIQRLLVERAANTERISVLVGLLDVRLDQPEEKRLLAAVKMRRAPYVSTYKRALAMLITEGKRDEARRIMIRETLPLLVAYHDAWNDFYQYQSDEIATAMLKSKADFVSGQRQFLLMVGLAGFITLAIAAFTVWRTGRDMAERKERTRELLWKTAFLEAQVNSSVDGILVVDQEGKMSLQNQRFVDLLEIPQHILEEETDENCLRWVADRTKDPKQFVEKVLHLYAHPSEISRDEIELKDGKILDRYSSPVVGKDGEYYGRIWTFRDITERRQAENALRESEDRFSGAFEHAPIGVALVSPEGRWLEVNQALCDLVGYSEAELQTRTIVDLTHPEDAELSREIMRLAIAGDARSIQMEERYVHKDGNVITGLLNISLVRDGQGQPRYFVAQIQDITERKRASALLIESQQRLALATESAHIGIWDWDLATNKLVWDRQMYELYGIREQDFSGAYDAWQKGLHPDDRDRAEADINAAVHGVDGFHVEFRVLWPNGEVRHIEAHALVKPAADGSPAHMIGVNWDITARKQAEHALVESNEKFHQLADNITDSFWIRSPDLTQVHYISPAFERIWGRTVESLYANPGQWTDFILPEDRERVLAAFAALTAETPSLDIEYRIVRPDGEIRWVRVRGFQVRDAEKKLIRHIGIATDITERKRIEVQLFQSQKMETVGKLAGGIAHEFNSIMTAIIGQSELLLVDLSAKNPLRQNAVEIRRAADRAAALTRQLLAYGRKQILQPELLDLNVVLVGMENTLRHLMGEASDVRIAPTAELGAVKVDAGQIEQVIMNIGMNAADAMPNGGKLTLETANVSFDQESVDRYPDLKPGDYVMLAITDTGVGMSEEVKARVRAILFHQRRWSRFGFGIVHLLRHHQTKWRPHQHL